MSHVPVLLQESVDGLDIKTGDTIVDATLGAGGHSSEIAREFGSGVSLVGFDLDSGALSIAKKAVEDAGGKIITINANFRDLERELSQRGIQASKFLFDLGVSSMELRQSGRGFSFKYDEPLLMTLSDNPEGITAEDVVNGLSEKELADVIYEYGEERFSRRIAKAIVEARRKSRIKTTFELSDVIKGAVPASYRNGRIHPATRTFQAIRIKVNDELGAIEEGLRGAWAHLKSGRIAVITFHSLEDRIVKNLFKEFSKEDEGILTTKKPTIPQREEVRTNPRSRSAKLRIIEKKTL